MRKAILFLVILMLVPFAVAADLDVEKKDVNPTVIKEIDRPAKFILDIQNNDAADTFRIYALVAAYIEPSGFFTIGANENKTLNITVYPHDEIKESVEGDLIFNYEIKGEKTGYFYDSLRIKIVSLSDAIQIQTDNIMPSDTEVKVEVQNLENFNFYDLEVSIESPFFEYSETINLSAKQNKTILVPINKNIQKIKAGNYDVEAHVETEDVDAEIIATPVKYLERSGISVETDSSGVIVREKTITKTNEGNFATEITIEDSKDILSRLFTVFSVRPDSAERSGGIVKYTWTKEVEPSESFSVTMRTNYTFPFVLLLLVILIPLGAKTMHRQSVVASKRVSFVKTKGGEFALKVRLSVKARTDIEDVKIVDRLPSMVSVYEKFTIKPDSVDSKNRKITWSLNRLNAGEERTFSYIIYSKINIVGRFELPEASVNYKKNGKHEFAHSNKTYFVSGTNARD